MNMSSRYHYLQPQVIYFRKKEQERHERKLKEIRDCGSSQYYSQEHVDNIKNHVQQRANRKQFNEKLKADELHQNNARILTRIIAISQQDVSLAQQQMVTSRMTASPKSKYDEEQIRIDRENVRLSSRIINAESELNTRYMAESFHFHQNNKKRIQKFLVVDEEKGVVKLKADEAAEFTSLRGSTRSRTSRRVQSVKNEDGLLMMKSGFDFGPTTMNASEVTKDTSDGYSPAVQGTIGTQEKGSIKRAMTSDRWVNKQQVGSEKRELSTARTTTGELNSSRSERPPFVVSMSMSLTPSNKIYSRTRENSQTQVFQISKPKREGSAGYFKKEGEGSSNTSRNSSMNGSRSVGQSKSMVPSYSPPPFSGNQAKRGGGIKSPGKQEIITPRRNNSVSYNGSSHSAVVKSQQQQSSSQQPQKQPIATQQKKAVDTQSSLVSKDQENTVKEYTFTDSDEDIVEIDEASEKLFSANSKNFYKDSKKEAFLIQERDDEAEEDIHEFIH